MKNENEENMVDFLREDRLLFSSLLRHIVRASPNEDSANLIIEMIGRNMKADRCYAYRFWDPDKSSMCTNTHEWCAEGIEPAIGGQQACDLSVLVEFNACIKSGRDFLFTDINAIDAGSRDWLAPQGIKSLIATPIFDHKKVMGFVGFDFVKAPCAEFTERIISNIHEAADLLFTYHRLHERDMAVQDVVHGEREYEANEREFERALIELQKDVSKAHPKHMLEIVQNRMDADICYIMQIFPDSSGAVAPENLLVRNGWANSRRWGLDAELGRVFDTRLKTSTIVTFHSDEFGWIISNSRMEDSLPDCLSWLTTLHCFGVRNEGRLVGVLCVGYNENRSLSKPLSDFMRRAAFVIVTTIERIATYRDLAVALNIAHLKGEIVEFMFKHEDYNEVKEFLGMKVCEITGAQHLLLNSSTGSRGDWFGQDAPACCHNCVRNSICFQKQISTSLLGESESLIVRDGEPLPDMNRPPYCPMTSLVIVQFTDDNGWWQLATDYTHPHKYNMIEVARGLRTALEFLAIAYDRDLHAKLIKRMQSHLRFRADTLTYALSKDDVPGLIDLVLHRLLDLTQCDYITIHSIEGDHQLLYPKGNLTPCPERCAACAFYHLKLPAVLNDDHIIDLDDTQNQSIATLSPVCPAKSLKVVVVYREGQPWGGIALHYLNPHKLSEDERETLKIAADVLRLALERHISAVRLENERDRVVAAEKSRSYFFSAISHDIRTPLNAIIGFSELLQAGDVPPDEAKRNLKMIMTSGRTLLQLINDVLDFSKMDLGKLEFARAPTDVNDVVQELVLMFQANAKEKGQTIVTEIPDLPRLMIDAHRFRQLLFNFIGNAIKYAGPCTIRLLVAYGNNRLKITVADNGKGVSAEKAQRLMQPFVQADIKNRTEGFGLGLAICKRLVELAHGTISIDTAPGKGFAIQVEFEAVVATEESVENRKVASSSAIETLKMPKRVLVVDDSPVNRAVLKAMLKRLNITEIELAEDGKAALDRLKDDQAFDIILSDMWMPVMDGSELVKHIREDAHLAHLNVCSITADVEARMTYKEQGFDSFLLKPVTLDKLKNLFENAVSQTDNS